ncbi:MAG: AmmeMemoRadiSam system radical SAM enzyme [Candidatus Micrarchaeota archaeon]|nr:AmmeMemoRadiSam system radical SAM enzyme [Candidatus Micrarchaeota archaeon]
MIVETSLIEKINDKLIRCKACARRCVIPEGKTGVCGVRKNVGGKLDLIVYGKPAAINVDPIEKKPLYHFLPGTTAFSLGTYGCNFFCEFCQNWELSQAFRLGLDTSRYYELPPEKAVELALAYGSASIAYTYNEPIIWVEYARDIGILAREKGLKNVFVSSGYETKEAWEGELSKFLDAANIDLKAFSDEFYKKYVKASLDPVLESIKEAKRLGYWVEITTLIIPTLNDSEDEIRAAAQFLKSVDPEMPWHLTAFHPDYKLTHLPPTRRETLERLWKIAKEEGMQYVYIGNVDSPYQNTVCPKCGEVLIERDWYNVRVKGLKDGKCIKCGYEIKGVWK